MGYILGCWGWGGGILCLCPLGWGTQPRDLHKLGLTMKSIKTMKNTNHGSICYTYFTHLYWCYIQFPKTILVYMCVAHNIRLLMPYGIKQNEHMLPWLYYLVAFMFLWFSIVSVTVPRTINPYYNIYIYIYVYKIFF